MTMEPAALDTSELIDSARLSSFHLVLIVMVTSVFLADGINAQVIGYIAPMIAENFGIERQVLGPVFSASLAGNIVGFLLLSPLSVRVGHKRMVIFCMALFGIGEIIASQSPNVTSLIVFRFIAGIGLAGVMPSAIALTGDYFPSRRRSAAITFISAGFAIGSIIAGQVTNLVTHQASDWRLVMMYCGIFALVLIVPLLVFLPESLHYLLAKEERRPQAVKILRRLFPSVSFDGVRLVSGKSDARKVQLRQLFDEGRGALTVAFWAAVFVNLLIFVSVMNWLPTFLVDAGVPRNEAIVSTQIAAASGLISCFLIGPLMDRFGPFIVMAAFFLLGSISASVTGIAFAMQTMSVVVYPIFALWFCTSGVSPGSHALAVYLYPPALRAPGIGWALVFARFGAVIGPTIVGYLVYWGWRPGTIFYAFAGMFMIGIAAFLFMWKKTGRKVALG